jgi:hypothetical protein
MGACRDKEAVEIRDEESGARPHLGGKPAELAVALAIACLADDSDRAFAADDVNAPAFGIDEDVIGIAYGRQLGEDCAAVCVKDDEHGRTAIDNEKAPGLFIQRHREVVGALIPRLVADLFFCRHIDNADLPRLGEIDEGAPASALKLKGFRMHGQRDLGHPHGFPSATAR